MLSTVGVVVSVVVVAVAAHFFLHCRWTIALLIGAILTSTDAAAVFSVLRRVPLPRRITGMLEAESGFNDAPVVILVTALAAAARDPARVRALVTLLAAMAVVELGRSAPRSGSRSAGSAASSCGGPRRAPRACSPSAWSP